MNRTGIYPGTFDPITNGHMDIIRRGLKVVDRLVIGIALDSTKSPIFDLDMRTQLVQEEMQLLPEVDRKRVEVKNFSGLLVSFAHEIGATLIVRGLRAVSDFEYEFQMANINSKLGNSVDTVFLAASETTHFISARFVKEICRLGGDISPFVSPNVARHLIQYYSRR